MEFEKSKRYASSRRRYLRIPSADEGPSRIHKKNKAALNRYSSTRNEDKKFCWVEKRKKQAVGSEKQKEAKLTAKKLELKKVRLRRLHREKKEEELHTMQRGKVLKDFLESSKQSDAQQLDDIKFRSITRTACNRAKPIDYLIQYITPCDNETKKLIEPSIYIRGLKLRELEVLCEDVKLLNNLDIAGNRNYWSDLSILVKDEIRKHKKLACPVPKDCGLSNKTKMQLQILRKEFERNISSSEKGIHLEFWKDLLLRLDVYMAEIRLSKLQQEKPNPTRIIPMTNLEREMFDILSKETRKPQQEKSNPTHIPMADFEREMFDILSKETRKPQQEKSKPTCISMTDFEREMFAILSNETRPSSMVVDPKKDAEQSCMQNKCSESFRVVDCNLETDCSPHKPKYFNRVRTNMEWNKFQLNCDLNNPPPKVVKGYMFNIFYPDLMGTSKVPQYSVTPSSDTNYQTLRFHSVPPYKDLTFQIVNRKWNHCRKKGFKRQFENGVFKLWFNFKHDSHGR